MSKMLKRRKLTDSEKDYQELRLLRQMLYLAEQQNTYRLVNESEYQNDLKKISARLDALERKYNA